MIRYLILSIVFGTAQVGLAQGKIRSISGVVRDSASQEALPGVNVVEIGAKNGALTDFDGRFYLEVSKFPVRLSISIIGFITKTVMITETDNSRGSEPLEIALLGDATLDQVKDVLIKNQLELGYLAILRNAPKGFVANITYRVLAS